jgi:hypothetical protein
MADAVVVDWKATGREVRTQAAAIRRLANELGLTAVRLRDDGTVVIHSSDPGYRTADRLSASASRQLGAYVHVITDDVRERSPPAICDCRRGTHRTTIRIRMAVGPRWLVRGGAGRPI